MTDQPTNDQLQAAWTAAIHAADIPGARADAIQELRRLRDARSTWFGSSENILRVSLDLFLKNSGA